jgi:CRISPR-associated protein Cas1
MKRLLNTLYVTTPEAHLYREGETIVVKVDDEVKLQVPVHTLGSLVCFGHVYCSPALMGLCGERNVTITFLSMYGRFLARVEGPVSGNVLLRREQYRRADDAEFSASFARNILAAKINNSRTVLLRAAREQDSPESVPALKQAAADLAAQIQSLAEPLPLHVIRGKEGDSARTYFEVFNHLITAQKDAFVFHDRNRRPPLDNVNALLSFLYTILAHDVASSLEGVGLDPAVGFMHEDRPGRPGLALDIMEEFRAYLTDRLVLNLINLKQVKPEGFVKTESGAVVMDDATRKTVLVEYQKRKQEEITHPFLDEKLAVGLLPHAQAMLLARFLRGDLDGYPPFVFR